LDHGFVAGNRTCLALLGKLSDRVGPGTYKGDILSWENIDVNDDRWIVVETDLQRYGVCGFFHDPKKFEKDVAILLKLADAADPHTRFTALWALSKIAREPEFYAKILEKLTAASRDPSPQVREFVEKTLNPATHSSATIVKKSAIREEIKIGRDLKVGDADDRHHQSPVPADRNQLADPSRGGVTTAIQNVGADQADSARKRPRWHMRAIALCAIIILAYAVWVANKTPPVTETGRDETLWRGCTENQDLGSCDGYLKAYPNGERQDSVRSTILNVLHYHAMHEQSFQLASSFLERCSDPAFRKECGRDDPHRLDIERLYALLIRKAREELRREQAASTTVRPAIPAGSQAPVPPESGIAPSVAPTPPVVTCADQIRRDGGYNGSPVHQACIAEIAKQTAK
jgi:hypothetical protein